MGGTPDRRNIWGGGKDKGPGTLEQQGGQCGHSLVSLREPGIKGSWRGKEGTDDVGFIGQRMEFGLFSKINMKPLKSFK